MLREVKLINKKREEGKDGLRRKDKEREMDVIRI